jgi:hypothetical protein
VERRSVLSAVAGGGNPPNPRHSRNITLSRSRQLKAVSFSQRLPRPSTGKRLFDLQAQENRINLPTDPKLAAKLGVSPHNGGPLPSYSKGLAERLQKLESSATGQAAINGDLNAAAKGRAVISNLLCQPLANGLLQRIQQHSGKDQ